MDDQQPNAPVGYCQCGCGERTPTATRTTRSKRIFKGQPLRFLPGHNMRVGWDMPRLKAEHRAEWTQAGIPYGLCLCGCGRSTPIATLSKVTERALKGKPRRFLQGHGPYVGKPYEVEDRGFITPCWVWQRYVNRKGYGQINRDYKTQGAHRYFYEQLVGPIPEGLELDHLCRVRPCVNPEHLEPVTAGENLRRGDKTTLTAADVRAIRASSGLSQQALADQYGVGQTAISAILRGKLWREA